MSANVSFMTIYAREIVTYQDEDGAKQVKSKKKDGVHIGCKRLRLLTCNLLARTTFAAIDTCHTNLFQQYFVR